jgi:signal transduction histidine kinase
MARAGNARRPSRAGALRRLADRVLETAAVDDLARLLTHTVPETLDIGEARLLVWNHKLDAFLGLTQEQSQLAAWEPGQPEPQAPEAGYVISEGTLLQTPGAGADGVVVPLVARSGVVGSWILGARKGRPGAPPLLPTEARLLWVIATRSALALENHLYQKELIATERMAVLGTMAGMLAHDFRGPLTVIRGYAETLLEAGVPPGTVRERAAEIVAAVDRLERMTAETLDYAREGARLTRRRLDVHKALHDLALNLELELPGLEVVRHLDVPPGVQGHFDVDKLHRAVGNVAANARDVMGGSGRLELRAHVEPGTAEGAAILVLELTDEGPGVPEDIRDRVFEPFVTRGKRGGTGLGLAVTRRFVEDHGGTVALSLPSAASSFRGASFRIRVPLGAASPPSKARDTAAG